MAGAQEIQAKVGLGGGGRIVRGSKGVDRVQTRADHITSVCPPPPFREVQ